ncbi:hypothetical protein F5B19DRAFT_466050 [Rostrohypoxylon terebratum]|nr:hypothetical protein F5B19DRAFT_466050 [Rostrohypoxylon terebratum]
MQPSEAEPYLEAKARLLAVQSFLEETKGLVKPSQKMLIPTREMLEAIRIYGDSKKDGFGTLPT